MAKAIIDSELVDITDEEAASVIQTSEELAVSLRNRRNMFLAETDWWGVADRTMTQAEIDYRQALRDVPAQAGFPIQINWPTKP